jgi:hypothetical protein
MRGLLEEVLQNRVDETAQAIFGLINVVVDERDKPQKVIERFRWDAANDNWTAPENPTREANGEFEPPSRDVVYRYKQGKIGTDAQGKEYPVEGVVMRRDTVTLRTDSVFVTSLGAART